MDELTLGQKIKKARLELKLTQQEVAGDFITRNMLSKIENDLATPSLKTIKYLAERLNKPISYFLHNEHDEIQSIDKSLKSYFEHASFLVKNKEYEKCIHYINQFFKANKEEAQNVYYGRLLYILAKCKIRNNDYNSVDQILDNTIQILKLNKDHYYLANSYFYKSNIAFHRGEFEKVEKYVRKAIEEFNISHVSDILLEIKLFFSLGYALYKQEKYKESIKTLNYAIELSKEYRCFNNYGDTYMLLGNIYRKLNDIDKAIDSAKIAISFFHALGEAYLEAACQQNIGNYYLIINDFENAEKYLNEALEYFHEINNYEKAHTIRSDMQELFLKRGDYKKAIEYVKEIDMGAIKAVDKARVYMNLGNSYIGIKDYIKAEENLKKAEELLKNGNRYDVLTLIYDSFSHMYSLMKDFEKAYMYSEKSKELLKLSLSKN